MHHVSVYDKPLVIKLCTNALLWSYVSALNKVMYLLTITACCFNTG